MLWDDTYLYIYALLYEQHIWASIRKRDAVIFHDNDFEVFIDPSDNTYDYTEIEINALNTVWDLKLNKPYRMKGWANTDYNIEGLQTAVAVQGTLNDASDVDTSWSVEMAIPLQALQATFRPAQRQLGDDVVWRINFSRVQWQHRIDRCQREVGHRHNKFNEPPLQGSALRGGGPGHLHQARLRQGQRLLVGRARFHGQGSCQRILPRSGWFSR